MSRERSGHRCCFSMKKRRAAWKRREIRSDGQENWNLPEQSGRKNEYRSCSLTPVQWIRYGLAGLLLDLTVSVLFYRSRVAVVLFLPAVFLIPLSMRSVLADRKRERLAVQFRDGVLAVAGALTAGYSVENAWKEAAGEMKMIYGEDAEITRDLRVIGRKLSMGQTSETAVRSLAERSGVPEIGQFAEVFAAAKRSSGNLGPILRDTAESVSRRLQVQEEIRTLVSAKRLEQNIMCVMPAVILVYINLGSPGYTDPLYRGLGGRVIMRACLAVYGLAVYLGHRILTIEV